MTRRMLACVLICFGLACCQAGAATGRVIKVLPQFIDLQGRTMLSPSLYERDAYQVVLRHHPERRSGMRFAVQWKIKGHNWEPLRVRVQLRGIAEGNLARALVLEESVKPGGWFSRWTTLGLRGEDYTRFGEVTAWRVTLWEGDQLLGEQKSFLW